MAQRAFKRAQMEQSVVRALPFHLLGVVELLPGAGLAIGAVDAAVNGFTPTEGRISFSDLKSVAAIVLDSAFQTNVSLYLFSLCALVCSAASVTFPFLSSMVLASSAGAGLLQAGLGFSLCIASAVKERTANMNAISAVFMGFFSTAAAIFVTRQLGLVCSCRKILGF